MKYRLDSPNQLGELVRATRKHQGLRQDLLADMLGVSENLMGRLENGEVSVQWGKLFKVLELLGIRVTVDLPEGAEEKLARRARTNPSTLGSAAAVLESGVHRDFNDPRVAPASWVGGSNDTANVQLRARGDEYAALERAVQILGEHFNQLQAEVRSATQHSTRQPAGSKVGAVGNPSLLDGETVMGHPVRKSVADGAGGALHYDSTASELAEIARNRCNPTTATTIGWLAHPLLALEASGVRSVLPESTKVGPVVIGAQGEILSNPICKLHSARSYEWNNLAESHWDNPRHVSGFTGWIAGAKLPPPVSQPTSKKKPKTVK